MDREKIIKNSTLIRSYMDQMLEMMRAVNPDPDVLSDEDLEELLEEEIKENISIPKVVMDNNYTGESKEASLLSVLDWAMDKKPIVAGNGTFYKNQYEALNPNAVMLDKMAASRKAYKKAMFKLDDQGSRKYKELDRNQGNEKVNMNSWYGGSGMPTAPFYSKWSGPATTISAQMCIATTEQTFEAFIADNYRFIDLNECLFWCGEVLKEDFSVHKWFNNTITTDELYERLQPKIIQWNEKDEEILHAFINHLHQTDISRIYYKNNLIQFVKDHEYVQTLHLKIMKNVNSYPHVNQKDPNWEADVCNLKAFKEGDFKDASSWNHFVNKEAFMDPNDVPDSIKEYVKEYSEILMKYVYVKYLSFDRIYRLKNFPRQCVTVIDTDSNILSLDPYINYIWEEVCGNGEETFGRTKDENIFIIVDTLTYVITEVVANVLERFGEASNIPAEFRPIYNMKNEFFFMKLVIGKKKKRYLSKIVLREGNLMNPPKYDIKGFDFMKATTSEQAEAFYRKLIKKEILDPEEIDIRKVHNAIRHYSMEIEASIRRGELTYLPLGNAKPMMAYKDPAKQQTVRASLAWNLLYPDNMIDFPSKIALVKLNIFTPEDMKDLQYTYPDIYDIIYEKIFYDRTGVFVTRSEKVNKRTGFVEETCRSKGLQVLGIPSNARIPEWAMNYIDYNTMINDVISPFRPVLDILGIQSTSVGKTLKEANRKTEKLTNIIKF